MDNFSIKSIKQPEINSELIDDNIITISDIIEKLNNRKWKKIKNSIPGAKTVNTPRMIDIVRLPVDSSKPHIRVTPSLLLNKLLGYGKIEYIVS